MSLLSTTGCAALTSVTRRQYLAGGGAEAWLLDPALAPPKLRSLAAISTILWQRPWDISQHHVKVGTGAVIGLYHFDHQYSQYLNLKKDFKHILSNRRRSDCVV